MSLIPRNILSLIGKEYFVAGVVDAREHFVAGNADTKEHSVTGVADTEEHFCAGVTDTKDHLSLVPHATRKFFIAGVKDIDN